MLKIKLFRLSGFVIALSFFVLPFFNADANTIWCKDLTNNKITKIEVSAVAATCPAGSIESGPSTEDVGGVLNLGTASPIEVVLSVVKFVLGLLGLVSVVIIIMGGFRWMTAAGNDESIKKAKKILFAGLTGLVIVLVGVGVVQFAITNLRTATGA